MCCHSTRFPSDIVCVFVFSVGVSGVRNSLKVPDSLVIKDRKPGGIFVICCTNSRMRALASRGEFLGSVGVSPRRCRAKTAA